MRIFTILFFILSHSVLANTMVIPIESKSLNIELGKNFKWKNTCREVRDRYCYQIWKDDHYFALSSQKIEDKKPLKKICGKKVKVNKHKKSFCEFQGSLFFNIENQLFVVSYSGKKQSSKALAEFMGGVR